ncbi:uncharacterized protein LOC131951053 [Physella acuta]|uniref:uncharacterized protein LOC131951053 n=1 Tax=Physella acuta TaxID=109671 RepID=UPI0027DC5E29|nr:uncharacterized protein LOC131951053 [Physella acuta]
MSQEKRSNFDTIELEHISNLLKLYWSSTNKQTGGQGEKLDYCYKYAGGCSWCFGSITSSEAAKYLSSKCHSETEPSSPLKKVTGPLETIEPIKLASLLLAYNNSLTGALLKKSCVHDNKDFERSHTEAIFKLKHRRIVQFYGLIKRDQEIILYFENVKKGTLSYYISKHGVPDEPSTKLFTIQIWEGINYLYSNKVLNQDLRGNNILMGADKNIKKPDIFKICPLDNNKKRWKMPFSCSKREVESFDDETKIDIWSIEITGSTGHSGEFSAQDVYDLPAKARSNLPNLASSKVIENSEEIPFAEWLLQNNQFITDEQHLEMSKTALPSAATAVGGLEEVDITQDENKCILNHFAEILKLYWSIINKVSGGQDVILKNYHEDEVEASTWFDKIKSSEVIDSCTIKHSEVLKKLTVPLEVNELIKIASVLLAYNNSLVVDLSAVACVEDVEQEHSTRKNLSALVEKMSRAIETFLAFIPWDYTSCEREMQDLLPSLEVALKEFSVSVDTGNLENVPFEQQMVIYDIDILCAVLGLRVELASRLKKIQTELWFHQDELYYILKWIKSFERNMFQPNDVFYNMGFTEKKSKFISNNIPAHLFDLQSPLYWAESYIESMFRCHPLLSDSNDFPYKSLHNDYPYAPENIPFRALINFRKPRLPGTAEINIINVSDKSSQDIQNSIDSYLLQNSRNRHSLLFHGTDHVSAVSVLEQGIRVKDGHAAQDFTNKEGFYLSYSYHEAKDWAIKGGNDPAVIVFNIPQMLLVEADNNGRDLTPDTPENRREWEETIKYCRSGYNGDEPSRFRTYSFIKGHMCCNPQDVKRGHTPAKHSPPKLQLCVKKKRYAQVFGSTSHILCAVFYKKS